MVQFISDKSGLKTRSLGNNILDIRSYQALIKFTKEQFLGKYHRTTFFNKCEGTFSRNVAGWRHMSKSMQRLGTEAIRTQIQPSSQYVLVNRLSWKIVMGPRFKLSCKRLEKHGIEPTEASINGPYVVACEPKELTYCLYLFLE